MRRSGGKFRRLTPSQNLFDDPRNPEHDLTLEKDAEKVGGTQLM